MQLTLPVLAAIVCSFSLPCQLPVAKAVPANTQFVAHFNVASCASILGENLIENRLRALTGKNVRDVVNRIGDTWQFRPRDILGVTIFGTSLPTGKRCVLLWTNTRLDHLLAALLAADALVYETREGIKIGRLAANAVGAELGLPGAARHKGKAWIYVANFGETRAVLIGSKPERILRAARVLAGEEDSLADARRPRLTLPTKQSVIAYAVANGSPKSLFSRGVTSELASKLRGLTVTVSGEQQLHASATLQLNSEQEAEQVAAVIQGMRSLQLLRESETSSVPAVVETALREMSCRSDGKQVVLRTSLNANQLRSELLLQSGAKPRSKQKREQSY